MDPSFPSCLPLGKVRSPKPVSSKGTWVWARLVKEQKRTELSPVLDSNSLLLGPHQASEDTGFSSNSPMLAFVCLFGGHICLCSHVTPSPALKNRS